MKPEPNSIQALRKVLLKGRLREHVKGQVIETTDGNTVNLLIQGYVKRYLISNDGTAKIQIIYGPGDVFPITIMYQTLFNQKIYEGPEVFYYEAMTPTKIHALDKKLLLEEVDKNPILYRDFLQVSGKRLHSTFQGLENVSLKTSNKRVAHLLLYYARHFGEKRANSTIIKMPLTHQTIADILSLTRETVSICMTELRDKNLIRTNKHIAVPSIDRLEKEAYS